MKETDLEKISRKSGRKITSCKCILCKSQCKTPCLGTPRDIIRLYAAGYADRLALTKWAAGMVMGVVKFPVDMIQATINPETGMCTFYKDGLCELHEKGLKPTEGKLSHHSYGMDTFKPSRSLAWLIAQEWLTLDANSIDELSDIYDKFLSENLK
jgi:hypothetical protein